MKINLIKLFGKHGDDDENSDDEDEDSDDENPEED